MSIEWIPDLEAATGPVYNRIIDALKSDIRAGTLVIGARLPTHRALAQTLGVSLGTVTRAYAEAQRQNLLSGEPGRGVYVSGLARMSAEIYPSPVERTHYLDLRLNQPPLSTDGEYFSKHLANIGKAGSFRRVLDYDFAPGALEYRMAGAQWLAEGGVQVAPEQVVLCSGAQHGLYSSIAALTEPGDQIATEALNYPGLKQIAAQLRVKIVGIPVDDQGMVPERLDEVCSRLPVRLIVCTPRGHNPTSATMSETRLAEIISVARRHDLVIVEDDVYGPLFGEGKTIFQTDPDHTINIGSTSKALAPGLRLGFIVAPPALFGRIVDVVRSTTWSSSSLSAEFLIELIRSGTVSDLLRWHRREIAAREEIAVSILSDLKLSSSAGCYHAWIPVPDHLQIDQLINAAGENGLLIGGSSPFSIGDTHNIRGLRLALGCPATRADLQTALSRLRQLLAPGSASVALETGASPSKIRMRTSTCAAKWRVSTRCSMIDEFVEHFGRIDVLVNNAGMTLPAAFPDKTIEQWAKVLQVNLIGTFLCSQAAVRHMRAAGKDKIVNVTSVRGLDYCGRAPVIDYSAAKAGVVNLTKTLAKELAPNITVNAVAPGLTAADFLRSLPEDAKKDMLAGTPLGRFADPSDIANAILFLGSAESDFITGQQIVVDGGFSLKAG